MYRSYRFLKRIDYGTDIKTNLLLYLAHHRLSLQFYKWGTYFLIVVLVVVFLTDDAFMKMEGVIKIIVFSYFGLVLLITGPIVSLLYGKRVRDIELIELDE
jgi:hypothetical protein